MQEIYFTCMFSIKNEMAMLMKEVRFSHTFLENGFVPLSCVLWQICLEISLWNRLSEEESTGVILVSPFDTVGFAQIPLFVIVGAVRSRNSHGNKNYLPRICFQTRRCQVSAPWLGQAPLISYLRWEVAHKLFIVCKTPQITHSVTYPNM